MLFRIAIVVNAKASSMSHSVGLDGLQVQMEHEIVRIILLVVETSCVVVMWVARVVTDDGASDSRSVIKVVDH